MNTYSVGNAKVTSLNLWQRNEASFRKNACNSDALFVKRCSMKRSHSPVRVPLAGYSVWGWCFITYLYRSCCKTTSFHHASSVSTMRLMRASSKRIFLEEHKTSLLKRCTLISSLKRPGLAVFSMVLILVWTLACFAWT